MRNRWVWIAGLVGVGLSCYRLDAQITVDGTLDSDYGAAVSVQTVQTEFGNANPPGSLGGSELNAAYAIIESGRLYLMLTGNHEPNFNKLEIFIDSVPGGENTLSGTPDYDFLSGSSWNSSNLQGLTFDTGFEADYHLFSRWGGGTAPYEADFVNRQGGGSASIPGSAGQTSPAVNLIASGVIASGALGPNASGTALSEDIEFAINNNNSAGVSGGTAAADTAAALAVTTGMEFSISLADLGNPAPGTEIKIAAMIGNGDHNYLSNQILGGLQAPQGNLGGNGGGGFIGDLSGVNFNQFPGLQFFTITVPDDQVATVVGSFVQHSAFPGADRIDSGKSLAKEGSGPTSLTYDNLINTAQGINGLVFDVQALASPGAISAGDFDFQVSPIGTFDEGLNPPSGWAAAPAPSAISVVTGSPDRIVIEWPDDSIEDRWLRVTVKATTNTGLAADEVYYIGHLTGESGPSDPVYTVAFSDIAPIRTASGSTVDASGTTDIDKSGTVSFADISAMRSSVGKQLTNITIP